MAEFFDSFELSEEFINKDHIHGVYVREIKSINDIDFGTKHIIKDETYILKEHMYPSRENDITRKIGDILEEHPNIIKTFIIDDLYIIMEKADTDLDTYLKKGISCSDKKDIIYQLCVGVEALHHNRIIHNDIKPTNILIK